MSLENDFEDLEEMIESEGEGFESDTGYESEFESDNENESNIGADGFAFISVPRIVKL